MQDKIIVSINPVGLLHQAEVFINNEQVYSTEFSVNSFEKVILPLTEKYPTAQLYISGPKNYTYKFGDLLKDAHIHLYSKDTLDIQYI